MMAVLRSTAALRAAKTFGSATSAMVGATIDVVGIKQHVEPGEPRIHGAHKPAALAHHVDVIRGRNGAAALDARPDVGIDIGGAPVAAGRDEWRRPPAARCRLWR